LERERLEFEWPVNGGGVGGLGGGGGEGGGGGGHTGGVLRKQRTGKKNRWIKMWGVRTTSERLGGMGRREETARVKQGSYALN